MFCFQCQETCGNKGALLQGVCGKKAQTVHLMDELLQQLKVMACSAAPNRKNGLLMVQPLFMTITNANFDADTPLLYIQKKIILHSLFFLKNHSFRS